MVEHRQEARWSRGGCEMMAKIRPQILLAILALGSLALYAVHHSYVEIATGCIGGITALGMRLLEGGDN